MNVTVLAHGEKDGGSKDIWQYDVNAFPEIYTKLHPNAMQLNHETNPPDQAPMLSHQRRC
jgi:hypothetical protein